MPVLGYNIVFRLSFFNFSRRGLEIRFIHPAFRPESEITKRFRRYLADGLIHRMNGRSTVERFPLR